MACGLQARISRGGDNIAPVRVYVIFDERSRPDNPLGDAVETYIRLKDAEHFIEEVRDDDPELASYLRIEERELEAGGLENGDASQHGHLHVTRVPIPYEAAKRQNPRTT